MSYDREESILYLAHQLWEEDFAPNSSTQCYWQAAALHILKTGPKSVSASGSRPKKVGRNTLQFRSSPRIEMGYSKSTKSVTLFKPDTGITNPTSKAFH